MLREVPLRPYSRITPKALWWPWEGGAVSYKQGTASASSAFLDYSQLGMLGVSYKIDNIRSVSPNRPRQK